MSDDGKTTTKPTKKTASKKRSTKAKPAPETTKPAAEKVTPTAAAANQAAEQVRETMAAHAAPPQAHPSTGLAMSALLVGVVALAATLSEPYWRPWVAGQDPVEARVQLRLDEIKAENTATRAGLEQRIVTVESALERSRAPGQVLAAVNLRDAVNRGDAFASQLIIFRALSDGSAETEAMLAGIAGHAEIGIPSTRALGESFDDLAQQLYATQQRGSPSDTLPAAVSETVAQVTATAMRLRRLLEGPSGAAEGDPMRLARAEDSLRRADLAAVVTELEGLEDAELKALAQPWLVQAKARVAAVETTTELNAFIVAQAAMITPK
ncbi:MAG: hypothetical protein HOL85_12315 [Rhodospirillaceae bacterium]|nr:hypothetical protein [Rhodospirillaceae bacterium]MBT6139965.1 hypothetical protein [Rhodospirillaceae bacterium]